MSHHVRGRQFIFEEEPRWILLGLLMVMVVGMLIGLLLGVVIGLAGIFFFEMALLGLALFILYDAYDLTFLKKSGARDKTGFAFMVMFCTALVLIFMSAMRYSALALSTQSRCVVFSLIGVALALVAYIYARLCCQEDERKHHLGPCNPEGDELWEIPTFGTTGGAPTVQREGTDHSGTQRTTSSMSWRSMQRFLLWILRGQWLFEVNDWLVPAEEESVPGDRITVHNRSLKLIKVCLYSSYDMVCWVPLGGIAGSCVGFIRSGEKRTLTLPRPWRGLEVVEEDFRLKVFMPGLLDKELASYRNARRGQCFAFTDVEGVVRRSRLLSSERAVGGMGASLPLPAIESSEEEYALCAAMPKDRKFDSSHGTNSYGTGTNSSSPSGDLVNVSSGTSGSRPMLRKRSSCSLVSLPNQDAEGEKRLHQSPGSPISVGRKAAPDEIVVRNRSSEDVRALLFRADDYCYMVPVVGKLLACGDCILQGEERRFNPIGELPEYTLKVYSVGPAAKELTYLTVRRGNAYTFCDSLLS